MLVAIGAISPFVPCDRPVSVPALPCDLPLSGGHGFTSVFPVPGQFIAGGSSVLLKDKWRPVTVSFLCPLPGMLFLQDFLSLGSLLKCHLPREVT